MSTPPNIVTAARARRDEINKLVEDLTIEGRELDSFLQTAARIEAQLGLGLPKIVPEGPARKATRKDVVDCALRLMRTSGKPVSTGDVVDALHAEGFKLGGESSSASSIVSANLSATPLVDRNPDGPGWVESEAAKLL